LKKKLDNKRSLTAMKILLVEDNPLTAELLVTALTHHHHYAVEVATDGEAAWELLQSFTCDLILLDVILPKLDGITLCQRLRSQGNQTPIILLTAKDTSTNKVMGLDAGADDYIAKPFDLQELLARIRALLRRGGSTLPPLLEWRNLSLNPSTCEVTWETQPVHLTPKEYGLLELLLRSYNRIFSCGALIDHLWSFEEPPTEDTVRSHLKGLRMKLRAAGVPEDPIETVYGIGYRLKPADKEKNPTPNIEDQTATKFGEIWQRSKPEIEERLAVIEQAVAVLQQNKLGKKLRLKAEQEAHKLAGSLGMFGYDEGTRLAREIELLLQPELKLDRKQAQELEQLVVALRGEIQDIKTPFISSVEQPTTSSQAEARVMVVDDDKQVLTALKILLQPWGLKVSTLDNPLQFWDTVAAEQPDLLVLDVEMPNITGIDLCQEIRKNSRWSGLPVLFLTARTDVETMHHVFAAGADDYVTKPIVGPELVTRILNRLERTRLLKSLAEIDALTGVANRPKSTQELIQLLEESDRHNQPFSFAIVTLDNLKHINSEYGHLIGDRVLSRLAEMLQKTFSSEDVVGRWGGKEFVIGMPRITKHDGVKRLFEVLLSFRQLEFMVPNGKFSETFSAAVVNYPEDGADLQALYQTADAVIEEKKGCGDISPSGSNL
jgi:diguanylate cyclase (GGDEF)-like protein